jgi:glycosyltransferase involved in cell wall biosynthesis
MKIGIISDLFYPYLGGGEFYLINIEKQLIKQGHEVVHLTSQIKGTKPKEIFQGIEVNRAWIPFQKKFMLGRFFFPFTNFSKLDCLKDVDVIQSVTYPAAGTGWLLSKLLNKPSVLYCHDFFQDLWKYIRSNPISQTLYPLAENFIAHSPYDWAITPSNYSRHSLTDAGFNPKKITVIPHGIDPKFKPMKSFWRKKYNLEDKKVFGFIGRLWDFGQKGIPYLIEAAKLVVEQIPDARLVLAGSGYEKVEPLVKKFGLEEFVIPLGRIPIGTEPQFYCMLDVFCGASIAEGMSLVYAEASRCGIPVVSTNSTSLPELIKHNETGILVPPRNPKALAEATIKLLENKKLAEKMGKKGAEYTKKFTWENAAIEHAKVYEMLARR